MKELFEHWNKFLIAEEMPTQKAVDIATGGGEEMVLRLPKFRISEQWGTPGSDDRKIIEMFTSKIAGDSLAAKIQSLNSFVAECDAGCAAQKDVSEILANLVFLDSLSSVIYDFNDKTGGFLFESLLAALFGGDAEQIETIGGRNQDVTDIVDNKGNPMSLKFFFSGASAYVTASYNNLVASIEQYQVPMIYVVAIKNRDSSNNVLSIDFYQFTVGHRSIRGNFTAKDLGKKTKGAKKYVTSAKNQTGNGLGLAYIMKPKYFIGNLNLGGSREEMKRLGELYTERLGSVLVEIYQQLDLLSKNVNEYYLAAPEAKDSALRARQNAQTLKKDTEELS